MVDRTFLVTGAAGFIGSHSVDWLLGQGYNVVGVDNLRTGHLQNLEAAQASNQFEFVQADVTDESAMRRLFEHRTVAGVLHLAALVSVPESFDDPALNFHINVGASDLLARLCIEYDCKRLVFASSAAVYGNAAELPNRESTQPQPQSPYAAAKLASEIMLLGYAESYGLDVVCLRYFNIYGPRQDSNSPYAGVLSIFTQRFRAGLPITIYGDGEQSRDFVAVQDVARINGHALTTNKAVTGRFNVATGTAASLNQVLAVYRDVFVNASPVRYVSARIGDIRHSLGDPEKLQRMLRVAPETTLEQGLQALIAFPE